MKIFKTIYCITLVLICFLFITGCHKHKFSNDWSSDNEYHYHIATCKHSDEIANKASHTFVDNKCVICGYKKANIVVTQKYDVVFNANGGKFKNNENKQTFQVKEGDKVSPPNTPLRTNYDFTNWYKDSDLTDLYDFNTDVNKDITLYAGWKVKNSEKVVTFVLNYEGAIDVKYSSENGLITYTPKRSGYVFNGWYHSSGKTQEGYILDSKFNINQVVTEENLVLYAEWVEEAKYATQLKAPSVEISDNKIYWENIEGATGYLVEIYKSNSVIKTVSLDINNYDISFLESGNYQIKVLSKGNGTTSINSSYTIKYYGHKVLSMIENITIDISTSILSWNSVKNATSYDLYIDNIFKQTLTENAFDMSKYEAGEYSIKIISKCSGFQQSITTASIIKRRLLNPTYKYEYDIESSVINLTWTKVINANQYIITINGTEYKTTDLKYELDLNNKVYETISEIKIIVVSFDSEANYLISSNNTETNLYNCHILQFYVNNENYKSVSVPLNKIEKTINEYNPNIGDDNFTSWYTEDNKKWSFTSDIIETNIIKLYGYTYTGTKGLEFTYLKNSNSYNVSLSNEINKSEITELVIPNMVNNKRITSILKGEFKELQSLNSITLPFIGNTLNGTTNTHFGYIFGASEYSDNNDFVPKSLNEVIITGGESIKKNAFTKCNSLIRVNILNNVKSIEEYAFHNCNSLTEIIISSKVTKISSLAFNKCNSLINIKIDSENLVYDSRENCNGIINTSKNQLIIGCSTTIIPSSVTSIGTSAFDSCDSLTTIEIPTSITNIENAAFKECINLANITIPTSITSIGEYTFKGCNNLKTLKIPSSVTSIGRYAFYLCNNLTKITLPFIGNTLNGTTNTHFGYIFGASSYSDNNYYVPTSLKEVIITGGETIDFAAFYNCNNLEKIILPFIGNTLNGTTNTHFGYIFGANSYSYNSTYVPASLKKIIIKNGEKIEDCQFFKCSNLTSIEIPNSVISIGDDAFSGCSSLESITIPTSVASIGDSAFYKCSNLTSIEIPKSITSISEYAFYECSSLLHVFYGGTKADYINNVTVGTNNFVLSSASFIYERPDVTFTNVITEDWSYILTNSNEIIGLKCLNISIIACDLNTIFANYTVLSIKDTAFYGCNSLTSVNIPSTVTSIGERAFYNCISLISVNIPTSVTSIEYSTFYYCTRLTSITIPDSITSIESYAFSGCEKLESIVFEENSKLESIEDGTFYSCSNITNIKIPSSVTSIGNYAFSRCSSLVNIEIPKSLTNIEDYVFDSCNSLEYNVYNNGLYLGNNNNPYVILIKAKDNMITSCIIKNDTKFINNSAFDNCKNLKSVEIPSSIISIGSNAFNGCNSLENIEIPKNVISIGTSTLIGCNNLTSITLPFIGNTLNGTANTHFGYIFGASSYDNNNNYVPASLKEVIITDCEIIGDYAFLGCSSLTSVEIPVSVKSIGVSAFKDCSDLTSIEIPSSVTSIGDSAFYNCNNLTSVNIPSSVTSIGNLAFYGCSSLTSITLPFIGNTLNGTTNTHFGYIFGASEYSKNSEYVPTSLKEVIITDGESIGECAFARCSSLTSIEIPSSVTTIEDSAFSGCSSLTSIEIPKSVISIGDRAFEDCSNLTSIKVDSNNPKYDSRDNCNAIIETSTNTLMYGCKKTNIPNSITSINEYAFYYCSDLINIEIPNSVTSIGERAFAGCSSLETIIFEKNNQLTSIGNYAFYNCSSLANIEIPNSVTSIGDSAFGNCSILTSIEIPNSVTSIGNSAFYNCNNLTSITLPFIGNTLNGTTNTHFGYIFGASDYSGNNYYVPKSLKEVIITGGESIGYGAFYGCSNLTSIKIPSSVTSIERSAFSGCSSLTSIEIPTSVTSIGDSAFSGCSSLTSIEIPSSVTSIEDYTFQNCSSLTIYCEAPSKPSGWTARWNFFNRPVVWNYKY